MHRSPSISTTGTPAPRTTSTSSTRSGQKVMDGEDFPGPGVRDYPVEALAAGSYEFICSIHPTLMTGTLAVQ